MQCTSDVSKLIQIIVNFKIAKLNYKRVLDKSKDKLKTVIMDIFVAVNNLWLKETVKSENAKIKLPQN